MTRHLILSAVLALPLAITIAHAQSRSDPHMNAAPAKALTCRGQEFVFRAGEGEHQTKVTLCSDQGATTDKVVSMLEDAAAKIAGSGIAENRRTALVEQIKAKIAELHATAAPAAQPAIETSAKPLLSDELAGSAEEIAPVIAPVPVTAPPPPAKPRLTLLCTDPGQRMAVPCIELNRDTVLTVRSDEALEAGIALRFLRQGDARAEIALGSLRDGQYIPLRIPQPVCSGLLNSKVEIQIIRGGAVVDKHGPYALHC